MNRKITPAGAMALGGVLAALAVIIMSLGTLMPIMTYVCPVCCAMLLNVVANSCGRRVAWAWYGVVAIISALLAPDKESAAVFIFFGYYPIVKPHLDQTRLPWLWKGLLFNAAILVMYWLLMNVLGMAELSGEIAEMGLALAAVCLILGNLTFFLLDRMLSRPLPRGSRHGS